jgi:hypothetical protein
MTNKEFDLYTSYIWNTHLFYEEFDYPCYSGLYDKFKGSSEACDAMQRIWGVTYKNKKQFQNAYKTQLKILGEDINS